MLCIRNRQAARAGRYALVFVGALLALLGSACAAASRSANPGAPRANEPAYPVILTASEDRRKRALDAWASLTTGQGIVGAPAPELQFVTETLRALPSQLGAPLRLPELGGSANDGAIGDLTEEETRESLRRFIASAAPLLGVDTQDISLIKITNGTDGARRALYRQRPFDYPLRNGYGVIEVTFAPNRRVLGLSSTAIHDTERVARALAAVRPQQLTADKVTGSLVGRDISYNDADGRTQTATITSNVSDIKARELVVYPVQFADGAGTLALHLAWEIAVSGSTPPLLVYVDAVSGVILAATPAQDKEAAT